MARPASPHPTGLELQILKILWARQPQRVREVRQALADEGRDIAHTSVITTLNTMVQKRLLRREKRGNAFWFSAEVEQGVIQSRMLGDMLHRVFDGSAKSVVLGLFDCAEFDTDDLVELRQLINKQVKERRHES